MALRDTDHDMVAAAMTERVARFVEPERGECVRCGFPCRADHLDTRGICPDCQSGAEED
jgi:predicted Zn-ribbon and HTH transcriptional regulator